jgi:hypothetical protein
MLTRLVTTSTVPPSTSPQETVVYRGSIAMRFAILALVPLVVIVAGLWWGLAEDAPVTSLRCDAESAECVLAPGNARLRRVVPFDEVQTIESTPGGRDGVGRDLWNLTFVTKTRGKVEVPNGVLASDHLAVEADLRDIVIERRRGGVVELVLAVKRQSPAAAMFAVVIGLGLLAIMARSTSVTIELRVDPSSSDVTVVRGGPLRHQESRIVAADVEVVRRLPIARGWEVIAFVMRDRRIIEVTQGMPRAEGAALAARIAGALPAAKLDPERRATGA